MSRLIILLALLFVCQVTATNVPIGSDFPSIIDTSRLPFEMPSFDQVLNSSRLVLAHYFPFFPLSLTNKIAPNDYYSTWIIPSTPYVGIGGWFRARPYPLFAPQNGSDFSIKNMENDVRMAIARGINGWAFDTSAANYVGQGSCFTTNPKCTLSMMIQAIRNVDPLNRFKIVLQIDTDDFNIVPGIIKTVYNESCVYRWKDSKPVIAPFRAERKSAFEWGQLLNNLTNQGIPVAFMPTFLSLGISNVNITAFAEYSVGMGVWAGVGIPSLYTSTFGNAKAVRATKAPFFWMGMMPQTYKPKNCLFYESTNSLAFRNGWMGAIETNADIVHIATWNDYSESGQIIPVTDSNGTLGTGFYDLNGYFTTWYRNNAAPVITKDAVYYFYRKEPHNAVAPIMQCNTTLAIVQTPTNLIEVVTMTRDRAVLEINNYTFNVNGSGLNSFTIPLIPGIPIIKLKRNGIIIVNVTGNHRIYAKNEGLPTGALDLTYWSGSSVAISCYGLFADDSNVCGGNGNCTSDNQCQCNEGWTDLNCTIPICFNFNGNSTEVCSGHGSCTKPNNCQCNNGWKGSDCSIPIANNSTAIYRTESLSQGSTHHHTNLIPLLSSILLIIMIFA